ncbi:aldo/keto reductase [Guggenheimella bovis]
MGIEKLCFGTLPISPLQKNFPIKRQVELFSYAYEKGVRFFDTAELYRNYDALGEFLSNVDRKSVTISTKSYAYDTETAERSIELALRDLKTDYIDFFLLHEQEDHLTLKGHKPAIDRLLEYKKAGVIKRFGISTHYVKGAIAALNDERIEVVHPIINLHSIGIADGTKEDMYQVLVDLKTVGKFVYIMKALGGGHLLGSYKESLEYALKLPANAIAIGMQSESEIDSNVRAFTGSIDEEAVYSKRSLYIADWCVGCGNCVARCQQKALQLVDGKAKVDMNKCTLCSYCVERCPDFCIKVI